MARQIGLYDNNYNNLLFAFVTNFFTCQFTYTWTENYEQV